jgi:UDP-N-acetyl-2-amino-2-deoxyglucuronate dehydrogenase
MARKWRSAVVGTGVVGEWHCRVLNRLDDVEFVSVCDILPGQGEKALGKSNIVGPKVYTDLQQMLKSEKLDIVHVCTPSGNHLEPVVECMKAGVNVICEKPLEIKPDRIDRMIEAADKYKVKLAGIFQNRWNRANRLLHDAAQKGRFGTIGFAGCATPWYRTDQYYRDGGWRGTWALDGGGAIMNQSVHAVDLLQWIAGPVKTVSAYASSRIHPEIEVEDTLACALTFESGAHGTIMGATSMYPGYGVRVEIGGSNGSAVSENGLKHWRFADESEEDKKMIETLRARAEASRAGSSNVDQGIGLHILNVKAIHESWERGEEAETNGPEARKAVAIIVAMYESAAKKGQPIEVR